MNLHLLGRCAFEIGIAVLSGGIIGVQRALRGKVAGVRTHILICVGATLFTQISSALATGGESRGDVTRIASQVVVGCGFIGAGTIMRSGMAVAGITSAATIWVCAALGCAIGAGLYEHLVAGLVASTLTLFVLGSLPVSMLRSFTPFQLGLKDETALARYRRRLGESGYEFRFVGFYRKPDGSITVDLLLRVGSETLRSLEVELMADQDVLHVSSTPTT